MRNKLHFLSLWFSFHTAFNFDTVSYYLHIFIYDFLPLIQFCRTPACKFSHFFVTCLTDLSNILPITAIMKNNYAICVKIYGYRLPVLGDIDRHLTVTVRSECLFLASIGSTELINRDISLLQGFPGICIITDLQLQAAC